MRGAEVESQFQKGVRNERQLPVFFNCLLCSLLTLFQTEFLLRVPDEMLDRVTVTVDLDYLVGLRPICFVCD